MEEVRDDIHTREERSAKGIHPRQLSRLHMDFRRLENRADSRRIRATDT